MYIGRLHLYIWLKNIQLSYTSPFSWIVLLQKLVRPEEVIKLKNKWFLILLVFIFLCACTFIDQNSSKSIPSNNEGDLLERFDEVVKKAEAFAKKSGAVEVQSVFQHQTDQIWKIEFTNGMVVFYDQKTDEITEAK